MNIIAFLAKDRFNWADNVGIMFLILLVANQHYGWAFGVWAVCFAASVILRVLAEEQKQRTEARQ